MKKSKLEKISNEITNDENQAKWESGELGQSEEHAVSSTKTTIRLPAKLLAEMKIIAADNGMPYQTYIKHVLHLHVRSVLQRDGK